MDEVVLDEDDLPARRVDEVLTVLTMSILDGLEGKRRRRLQEAIADLRVCIETNGEGVMIGDEVRLLELERQFGGPDRAVARVAPALVLLLVIPSYLEETRWQGIDDEDRRVRMRLALRLARAVAKLPELGRFDGTCALADVDRAWRVANRRLRRERGERALALLPPAQRAEFEDFIARVDARRAEESREQGEPR
jgi:hypothetical protein